MRMAYAVWSNVLERASSILRSHATTARVARRVCLFALYLLTVSIGAFAYEPNWEWRVSGQSPTFPSHAQAAAFLHSLNDKAALMQNKGLVVADINYNQYWASPASPDTDPS